MNKKYCTLIFATALVMVSCGNKNKDNVTIITQKPQKTVQKDPLIVGNYSQKREIKWLNKTYKILVERKADTKLDIVTDENGTKFYDNEITVRILRSDDTEFYSRKFTKDDFKDCVDKNFAKHSVLLGIVYYEIDGNNLRFAASFGAPDKMSDEYVPLSVRISNMGTTKIGKDQPMTSPNDQDEEEDDEPAQNP